MMKIATRVSRLGAFTFWVAVLGLSGACASVPAWERDHLALEAMAPYGPECQRFEHNNEVYREGAVGANGGKSGGGCGCS